MSSTYLTTGNPVPMPAMSCPIICTQCDHAGADVGMTGCGCYFHSVRKFVSWLLCAKSDVLEIYLIIGFYYIYPILYWDLYTMHRPCVAYWIHGLLSNGWFCHCCIWHKHSHTYLLITKLAIVTNFLSFSLILSLRLLLAFSSGFSDFWISKGSSTSNFPSAKSFSSFASTSLDNSSLAFSSYCLIISKSLLGIW